MATIPFPYPDDLTRFPKETQRVLRMVHDLGWTMRWQGSNRNVVAARCPGGDKTINFPRTNINANRMKSWLHQIERYSDPERFAEWVEDNAEKIAQEQKSAPVPTPPPVPDTAVAAAMRAATEQAVDLMRPAAEAVVASRTRDTDDLPPHGDDDPVFEVHVAQFRDGDTSVMLVAEKPWLARKGAGRGGTGRMYESPHVIERRWSDGGIDYRCRWCPYTNDNPRSVAIHARSHPERKVPPGATRKTAHYEPTEIKRPMSAARRLASEITHVLDGMAGWQSMSPEELAQAVAEAVYEKRPDREPLAPLTPEQIINRIVGLVDQGRLADLHAEVDRLAEQLRLASEARAAAEAEAERLHEERRVLRDLLSESEAAS